MKEKARPKRVAEMVREEIARLLMKGVKDPRIGFVSVMSVRMSPDLRYANVYVSLFGDEKQRKNSLVGLQQAASWLRGPVTRNLRLRFAPEIRFFPDDTLDNVFHLENVFRELHEKENKDTDKEQPDNA
jgi:ribosome-binding factor A